MAQIRLDDEVYDRLKECADADCRTVGEEIHYLLDNRITLEGIHAAISEKNMPISQAKEKKEGETLVEVKSYSQLKAERARIEADYAERIGFCQDTDSVRALYAEMNRELAPIDNQINAIFNKEEK